MESLIVERKVCKLIELFYHMNLRGARNICRISNMEEIGTFFGYLFKGILLVIFAAVYLPAFLIVNFLTKPWEELLKEFGL